MFTAEELARIYRELSPEDQQVINGWSVEEKEKYLQTRARATRESSRATSGRPTPDTLGTEEAAPPYTVDPLLKEAMTKYADVKTPREEVLALFEQYLKQTPDSVFLPEIYFRMAALYSMHRRVELGEAYDRQKTIEYFQKAHALYGTQYSHLHLTAWESLANMPESGLEFRKEYLRWVQGIADSGVIDIWPIREIEQTFNGRPPELGEVEKETRLQNLQKYQDLFFQNASKNVFYVEGKNQRSLRDLARSFPGTELAKQCTWLADARDRFYLDAWDAEHGFAGVLQDEREQSRGLASGAAGAQAHKNVRDPNAKMDPNIAADANEVSQSTRWSKKGSKTGRAHVLARGVGLVALATIGLYIGRRLRRKPATGAKGNDSEGR